VNVRQTVKVEREGYEVETGSGKFYVQILDAKRKTYISLAGDQSVPTEEITGRVWVATDPEFKGEVGLGFVTIRGRKYTIEHIVHRVALAHGRTDPWHTESSWRGGYRNEKGQQVSYDTASYGVLGGYLREALDKFHQEHPEWEKESIRLLFERKRNSHASKARELVLEADQEDIKAAQWQKRLDDLLAS
jgi:hypothetical protein